MTELKLTRENFRVYYDFKSGLKPYESLDRLATAFGDKAPSHSMVYAVYAEFKRGNIRIGHQAGGGRPRTAYTPENIEAVRKLIEEDPNITYKQIQSTVKIGTSQIQKILHDELKVKKEKSKIVDYLQNYNKATDRGTCKVCNELVSWSWDRLSSHKRSKCKGLSEEDRSLFAKRKHN